MKAKLSEISKSKEINEKEWVNEYMKKKITKISTNMNERN